jgi:hypothetical protein
MKRIRFPLLVLFALSIRLTLGSEAPALIDRPNADSGPTQISVGIWVADISNIDSAQQTFTAELAVVLRWKDSRLAHTGKGIVRYPLEQIWHPRLSIVNETNSVSRKFPDSVEVDPDGTVTSRQRYAGAFTQPLRLQSFPFDRQTFRVQLVAVSLCTMRYARCVISRSLPTKYCRRRISIIRYPISKCKSGGVDVI